MGEFSKSSHAISMQVAIQNIRGEWDNSVDIIAAQLNYKF